MTLLALFASTLAGAAKVEPVLLEGASNEGKDCADNVGSGQIWTQLKIDIDPLVDGVYSDGTLTVTISNAQNDKTFDWSSNIGVDAVVVKGGSDGAYLYRYDPPSETTSDSGLTTPGQNAISHVNFCYDVGQPPAKGTIIVEKQLDPDGYQPPQGGFPFSGAIQAVLGDGQTAQAEVDPGTYTVTESLAGRPFWDLTSLQCNDGNSSGDLATLTATYRVEAGETVRCVFTNAKRSLIIVKKLTNPAGAQQSFAFDASYDQESFSLSHGQQNVSDPLLPGSYSVTEHSTPGWQLQSATCDNGDDPGDIDLPASVTVTCTFTNAPAPPKLTPTVVTDVHNADHQVVTQAAIGSSVHDSATVSGSGAIPTGSVDFRVYLGNLQCSGEGSAAGTVALDGSGVAHPSNSAVVPAGGLSFRGHYSGDAVYTAGDGPCETLAATQLTAGQGSINVEKDANPTSIKEPGGSVTFSVRITNTSTVNVAITNVVDDKFGDLDDSGGNGCFDVPVNLAPGASVSCQFVRQITGTAGGPDHVDTVCADATDEFGNALKDCDDARVTFTPKLIDLVIVKDASSPTPLNGTVNYSLTVTNKGPDTATNVQLADPAPAGIEYQSASPSQGSCAVGPALVTCNLGTINPGQTVTIAIKAKATTVGTHINTATVTGSGGRETNPADNIDSAQTIVPAPLRPPTVKPEPPAVESCLSLTVTPKMIKADGKPDRVTAKVRAGSKPMKGAKVLVKGVGVRKTGITNGKGVVVIAINPRKPGLITITTLESQKSCGAKRIGVVGVFLPPLTG